MEAKTYYAKAIKTTISINVEDPERPGKPMIKRDALTGNIIMQNGRAIPITRSIQFKTISDNPKLGYLCQYTTGDEMEIKRLDECVNNGHVMTEAEYKRQRNPEAYRLELEKKKTEGEIAKLKTEYTESQNALKAMQSQLEEMKKQAESQRNSGSNFRR